MANISIDDTRIVRAIKDIDRDIKSISFNKAKNRYYIRWASGCLSVIHKQIVNDYSHADLVKYIRITIY